MRRSVGSVSTVGTVGSKKSRSSMVQGQRQLFGTVPVPSESSSRFPNEALEDSARDSSAHLKLLSKEAKRESESVIRQAEQGLLHALLQEFRCVHLQVPLSSMRQKLLR